MLSCETGNSYSDDVGHYISRDIIMQTQQDINTCESFVNRKLI